MVTGADRDGIRELCTHLGYTSEQYKIGKYVVTYALLWMLACPPAGLKYSSDFLRHSLKPRIVSRIVNMN